MNMFECDKCPSSPHKSETRNSKHRNDEWFMKVCDLSTKHALVVNLTISNVLSYLDQCFWLCVKSTEYHYGTNKLQWFTCSVLHWFIFTDDKLKEKITCRASSFLSQQWLLHKGGLCRYQYHKKANNDNVEMRVICIRRAKSQGKGCKL